MAYNYTVINYALTGKNIEENGHSLFQRRGKGNPQNGFVRITGALATSRR
jgi:hypothetical protein